LKSFASSVVSEACSCIATTPTSTITTTTFTTNVIDQTTSTTSTSTSTGTTTATTTISAVETLTADFEEISDGIGCDYLGTEIGTVRRTGTTDLTLATPQCLEACARNYQFNARITFSPCWLCNRPNSSWERPRGAMGLYIVFNQAESVLTHSFSTPFNAETPELSITCDPDEDIQQRTFMYLTL